MIKIRGAVSNDEEGEAPSVPSCSSMQICNACGAPFKMDRGCYLEKRCLPCRFLGAQRQNLSLVKKRIMVKDRMGKEVGVDVWRALAGAGRKYLLTDERDFWLYSFKDNAWDYTPSYAKMGDEMVAVLMDLFESVLNEREKFVMVKRYFENLTAEETGLLLDVGHVRVQQIYSSAIRKLQHPRFSRRLQSYREEGEYEWPHT